MSYRRAVGKELAYRDLGAPPAGRDLTEQTADGRRVSCPITGWPIDVARG
jgi:hypothetical protein